ncbi:hypothetical protein [Archaeoglobus veneficus]|uniref:Xylose isomerase domain-containing protein TIM barrel n=1 Tax=Archaeoglobus veneficus (strain DSM 11195 / SNP6) TaxID=693661 RepID=F2KQW0_ARCVS|nr:hypothetical protein [Archaeoglobus veneficus]AEA47766.1 hypothetical protein Arcve_1769 [Archaeoglobus veneficus SNP6]
MNFGWNPAAKLEGNMHSILRDSYDIMRTTGDFSILELSVDFEEAERLERIFNPDVRRMLRNFCKEYDFEIFLHLLYGREDFSRVRLNAGDEEFVSFVKTIVEFFDFVPLGYAILHTGRRFRRLSVEEQIENVVKCVNVVKDVHPLVAVEMGRKGAFMDSVDEILAVAEREVEIVVNTSLLWAASLFDRKILEENIEKLSTLKCAAIHWGASELRNGREIHNLSLLDSSLPAEIFKALKSENHIVEIFGSAKLVAENVSFLKKLLG